MTDRAITYRIRQGAWLPVHKSVFRLAGVPVTWEQEVLAAVLRGGEGAAASHRAAARLHKLKGDWGDSIEISSTRRIVGGARTVYHRAAIAQTDIVTISGISTTSVCRTLIDLAAAIAPGELARTLDHALLRRQVSLSWLHWRIQDRRGLNARALQVLSPLIAERVKDGHSESELEEVCWRIIEASGLPLPKRQLSVAGNRFRLDFAYPDLRLCIECDGYAFHSAKRDWERDLTKANFLTESSWRIIRTSWEELKLKPEEFLARLRTMLAADARR